MLKKFDFRITFASMAVLAVATVIYVLGVRYLALIGDVPRLFGWLSEMLGKSGAAFVFLFVRGLETLLFILLPFRSHVRERASLFLVTLGVSFAVTVATNYVVWGGSWHGVLLLGVAYFFAWVVWGLFIYEERHTPAPAPELSTPAQ